MAAYKVGTFGGQKLIKQLTTIERQVHEAAIDGCVAGANLILSETNRLIRKTAKSGKVYKSAGVGEYRASAAGEAPANRTGALASSHATRRTPDGATVGIHEGITGKDSVSTLEYARRLEYGFIGVDSMGRKYGMAARPSMKPAFYNRLEDVKKVIKASVNQALKKAGK